MINRQIKELANWIKLDASVLITWLDATSLCTSRKQPSTWKSGLLICSEFDPNLCTEPESNQLILQPVILVRYTWLSIFRQSNRKLGNSLDSSVANSSRSIISNLLRFWAEYEGKMSNILFNSIRQISI